MMEMHDKVVRALRTRSMTPTPSRPPQEQRQLPKLQQARQGSSVTADPISQLLAPRCQAKWRARLSP